MESGEIRICLVSSEHIPYGAGMLSYALKIPAGRKASYYDDPYSTLESINHELRRNPGVTDEDWNGWDFNIMGTLHDKQPGMRYLNIDPGYGIRHQGISAHLKKSFKEVMPKLAEMIPEMQSPFKGRIEFFSTDGPVLQEVRFIPQ